jgi:hypothetical protein
MEDDETLWGGRIDDSAKFVFVVIGAGGHAKDVFSTLRANGHSIGAVFDHDATLWEARFWTYQFAVPLLDRCKGY